jgi:hypothetical protein
MNRQPMLRTRQTNGPVSNRPRPTTSVAEMNRDKLACINNNILSCNNKINKLKIEFQGYINDIKIIKDLCKDLDDDEFLDIGEYINDTDIIEDINIHIKLNKKITDLHEHEVSILEMLKEPLERRPKELIHTVKDRYMNDMIEYMDILNIMVSKNILEEGKYIHFCNDTKTQTAHIGFLTGLVDL